MVLLEIGDALGGLAVRAPVGRQHQRGIEGRQAVQGGDEVVQRVGRALGMEPHVGADVRQQLVSREQDPPLPVEQADVSRRMAGCPLHAHTGPPHRQHLGAVQLDRDRGGEHEVAHGAGGVALGLGLFLGNAVGLQVAADLRDQLLQLEVARIDHRHLQPVHVELGSQLAADHARGAVVVRVDVRDEQPSQPPAFPADVREGGPQSVQRFPRVHATVEEIELPAVPEDEDVDPSVFERDRQLELVHPLHDLSQLELDHPFGDFLPGRYHGWRKRGGYRRG